MTEEVLTEWEIPYSKVSPILTDSGSNMNEEGYLLPTIARKNNLPTFRLNAPVDDDWSIQSKRRQVIFPSYSW